MADINSRRTCGADPPDNHRSHECDRHREYFWHPDIEGCVKVAVSSTGANAGCPAPVCAAERCARPGPAYYCDYPRNSKASRIDTIANADVTATLIIKVLVGTAPRRMCKRPHWYGRLPCSTAASCDCYCASTMLLTTGRPPEQRGRNTLSRPGALGGASLTRLTIPTRAKSF
ncbi:hypothetical protein EVAR_81084_1 [Eumeta japonica]|uniref:Uncharacterized protein n=1 Tax=Eumeta variegata TaxID=151549 RepID=A0A4C1T5M2_EUMVA|nr:hypothetical protein EVAR_81084_1 [Eumeta japonica]